MSISVQSTVVCDDVRREDNGKHILIGVYAGALFLQSIPAALASLGFYFETIVEGSHDATVQIQVKSPDGTVIMSAQGEIKFDITYPVSGFGFKAGPVTFAKEGRYEVLVGFKEPLVVVKTFDVIVREALAKKA